MDYKTSLTKIKHSDAEAIIFSGFEPHYINVMKNMQELNINLPFFEMSPNTMYPSVIQEVGQFSEGNIAISLDFPLKGNDEFVNKFKNDYGRTPNLAASLGYDTIKIIGKSTKGKKIKGDEIINKIVGLKNIQELNGSVKITEFGETDMPVSVIIVKDGKIQELP